MRLRQHKTPSCNMLIVLALLLGLAPFSCFALCDSGFWNPDILGETQGDTLPLYDYEGRVALQASTAQLRQLTGIKQRLSRAAGLEVPLILCGEPGVANAHAVSDGRRQYLFVTLEMLRLQGANPDALAAVIAHEIAHVALGHLSEQRSDENDNRAADAAVEIFIKIKDAKESNGGKDLPPGLRAARLDERLLRQLYQAVSLKLKREDELEADYRGIQLMTAAGINPEGAVNALRSLMNTAGNSGGFSTDHPLTSDRIAMLNEYLAKNAIAKALVAKAGEQATDNEGFRTKADELLKRRSWSVLGKLLRQWKRTVSDSAMSWYYDGLYQRGGRHDAVAARKSFYQAVELNPSNIDARLELCVSLFQEGRKLESVYCSRVLIYSDDFDSYSARTFEGGLHIGGVVEPITSVLAFTNGSGKKYLTNDRAALRRKDLTPRNYLRD